MLFWIKRFVGYILGVHICEEFTQWEVKMANWSRYPSIEERLVNPDKSKIVFTKKWQERHCTLCGKMQQRGLDY